MELDFCCSAQMRGAAAQKVSNNNDTHPAGIIVCDGKYSVADKNRTLAVHIIKTSSLQIMTLLMSVDVKHPAGN